MNPTEREALRTALTHLRGREWRALKQDYDTLDDVADIAAAFARNSKGTTLYWVSMGEEVEQIVCMVGNSRDARVSEGLATILASLPAYVFRLIQQVESLEQEIADLNIHLSDLPFAEEE